MQMREVLSRTVTVVACLPTSWTLIENNAVASVGGRFRTQTRLALIPSAEIATELVTGRFEQYFEIADFKPPYPTWPVAPVAFRDATDFTPRGLLQRVDKHVQTCLSADEVVPLTDLAQAEPAPEQPIPSPPPGRLTVLDERLARLREQAVVDAAL